MKLRNVCCPGLILALVLFAGGCSGGKSAPFDGGSGDGADGSDVECTGAAECDDGNACTDDACSDGECVYTNNENPCDDGQACSESDICSDGVCAGTAVGCDDGNPCTTDSCDDDSGCVFIHNTAPCDDGDVCTLGDRCADGSCRGGDAIECEDGNPCTDDACDPASGCVYTNNEDSCDDGQACSENDHCSNGVCVGDSELDCDDQNPCTEDHCDDALECVYSYNLALCDDSNACTAGDACDKGVCAGASIDCGDGNVCTTDSCDPASGCVNANNTDPCEDGDDCTVGDTCANGACQPGGQRDCDDINPCTDDDCLQGIGCTHANNTGACDDGNPCTDGDRCQGGECLPGASPFDCDDGDPCTDDDCNLGVGCSYSYNTALCDDGDACTMGDVCSNGVCAGVALDADGDGYVSEACGGDDCDDGSPGVNPGVFEGPAGDSKCTDDVDNNCNDLTDDQEASCGACNDDPDCDDDNVCNGAETCAGNTCAAGAPLVCDDSNACTTDTCDQVTGCQFADNALPCDDGNACTVGDVCSGGSCLPGAGALDCDDGNPCTTDSCDDDSGCVFIHNTAPCDDGDPCTTGDACSGGSCQPGAGTLDCDDGNPCTDDSCFAGTGCVNTADDANPCDDGDPCTENDRCSGGSCVGNAISCDDADVCTDDSCDPASGCVYTNNNDPCDDGDACTVVDQCLAGNCAGALRDQDDDGYGDGTGTCPGDDCDDADPLINPGVPESCGDSIDNNCNDVIDEGCSGCDIVDPSAQLVIDNDQMGGAYALAMNDQAINVFFVESSSYNAIEVQAAFYDFSCDTGGDEGTFSIHILADDGGAPGAELAASASETVSRVGAICDEQDIAWHTFTLAAPVAFTHGQLFWVALQIDSDESGGASPDHFLPFFSPSVAIPYFGGFVYDSVGDQYGYAAGNWLLRVDGCAEGPWLTLDNHSSNPAIAAPGGSATVSATLLNRGFAGSAAVTGTLSCDEPEMVVTTGTASYGTIATGASASGSPDFGVSPDASAYGIYDMMLGSSDGSHDWLDLFGLYVQGSGCLVENATLQVDSGTPMYYLPLAANEEAGNYFLVESTSLNATSVSAQFLRDSGPASSRFRAKLYTYRAGLPDQLLATTSWVPVSGSGTIEQTFSFPTPVTLRNENVFFVTIESESDLSATEFALWADDGYGWANGVIFDQTDGAWMALSGLSMIVRVNGCQSTELVYESHTSNPDPIQKGGSATLNITIRNVGAEDAIGIEGTLSSPGPDVTVTDAVRSFGNVGAGLTSTASGFGITVAAGASEFQYPLDLELTDGTETWEVVVAVQLDGATRNLAVQNFSTILVGNDIQYHWEVVNTGNVDIIDAFDVDLYIDRASAPGVGAAGDWTDTPTFLGIGQSLPYDLVLEDAPTGSYDAWVQVDTNGAISEANEGDNVAGPQSVTIGAADVFELLDPPAKWFPGDMPVGFRFVAGNTQAGMTQADARDAVRTGFAQWDNVASANLSIAELAEAGSSGYNYDGYNTMTFNDPYGEVPGGALASTLPIFSGQTMQTNGVTFRRMTDADIVINNGISYVRNGDPCSFEYDLDGVATHEIGHLFGLDHPDVATATMYYSIGPCDMSSVSLDQSDINGITFIYP